MAPDDLRTGIETASLGPSREPRRGYLLVVRNLSSTRVPLPEEGEVILGRGGDCGVLIDDPGASRRHASILLTAAGATLTDLGSRHGTTLNNQRLGAPRPLFSGDVIGVGEAVLVAHLPSPSPRAREIDGADALARRIEQEIDRARAYDLCFSLLSLGPFPSVAARLSATAALASALPPRDTVASDADGLVWVLFPEVTAEEARSRVAHAGLSGLPRAEVVSYPRDGCTAGALLRAARPGDGANLTGATSLEGDIVLASPAMMRLYSLIRRLARGDLPVLIRGETGVGKEHAARSVHGWSARSKGAFVAVNCAALADSLAEAAFFGHEKGAFTGATERRAGFFEAAAGGTLFLDEIGELSPAIQAKLLRAIELRRVTRLGSTREIETDVRVVAATHRNLANEVAAGRFRQDLLYRLGTCVVEIPPLRERPEEILLMARRFLDEARGGLGLPRLLLSAEVAHRLTEHPWPGNVRELRGVVAYAAAVAEGDTLQSWDLPVGFSPAQATPEPPDSLPPAAPPEPAPSAAPVFVPLVDEIRALERRRIEEALAASDGVQRKAAALLHMPLRTFCVKLRQHELTWPERWHKRG